MIWHLATCGNERQGERKWDGNFWTPIIHPLAHKALTAGLAPRAHQPVAIRVIPAQQVYIATFVGQLLHAIMGKEIFYPS
jgi:hypothetical protein